MERREAIPKETANFLTGALAPALTPCVRPITMTSNPDRFREAWEEGHLAQYGGEPRWAQYYYQQALEAAPEDIDPETLADILEGLRYLEHSLAYDEKMLPFLRSAVADDPCDSEKRFRYANLLWRLGRDEEAGREFEATILHPETLCPDCARDCCNNLGWYLYRKGEYAKALPWFERAVRTRNFNQFPPGPESPVPFENIILVYAALNKATEAEEATLDYISRFGRLPWPERRALQKLNINADALFIEQCGRL